MYDENGLTSGGIPAEVFVEDAKVTAALGTTAEARDGWLDFELAVFFLYFSLGLALVIFSFRITQVRTWFIALIGAGIWVAVFGVFGAVMRTEYGLMVIFLLLTIAFLITAIYLISHRDSKRIAGVTLLWALWAIPAFLPLLAAWIWHMTQPAYDYSVEGKIKQQPAPVYDWISSNWPLINGANVLLVIGLIAFLFIPLARKWQAMPEE